VIDLVLDATVVLPWFRTGSGSSLEASRRLRTDFEAGRLAVTVPSLLYLEVVNVAGRQWGWDESALVDLANHLEGIGFEVAEPPLPFVASWVARGLTAYDATYVALAEVRGISLVTGDRDVLKRAGGIARSAASVVGG
jgi:hypothetical protein